MASASILFSVCSPSIRRAEVTGTPASMMETNCRQNTARSRGLGFRWKMPSLISLDRALASVREIRVFPSARSSSAAACWVSASMLPFTSLPAGFMTRYA